MSGDVGVDNEPIIFYSEEMTMAKLILLSHKGIPFHLYTNTMEKINNIKEN